MIAGISGPELMEWAPWVALGLLPLMAGAAPAAGDHGHAHGYDPHADPRERSHAPGWLVLLFVVAPALAWLLFGVLLGGEPIRAVAQAGGVSYQSPLLLLIVLLPGLGALFHGTIGQKMPRFVVSLVACGVMVMSFFLSLLLVLGMHRLGQVDAQGQSVYPAIEWTSHLWIESGSFSIPAKLVMDPLSAMMLMIITGVGSLIHLYSTGYIAHDRGYARYFTYLNLFVSAMLILVLGGNLLVTFVGWEGVGMCSYLLIGFWFTDDAKASAGKKAFVVNRVGDFAFILAMLILFVTAGTLDYGLLAAAAADPATAGAMATVATAVGLLTFVGCTGKSAQIPLYVWLPDAMAGPTPVSALIHAATMVTAGVYLIIRLNFLFVLSPTAMWVIMLVGGATALMAASIGLVQNDIKKVLAYSTVSQLGYMFMAVGAGAYVAGAAHLMTHAFFKALLFLGSGSVIHGMSEEQDMRKMGGLRSKMPWTHATYLIGCLAIAGVPGLSGFFSKDEILWGVLNNQREGSVVPWLQTLVWVVGVLTAGMTAFYMFRSYFMTFWGESRAPEEIKKHIHESPFTMVAPLVVLGVFSVLGGYLCVPEFMAHAVGGHNLLHGWLDQLLAQSEPRLLSRFGEHPLGAELGAMGASIAVATAGIAGAYVLYVKRPELPGQARERLSALHRVVYNKYYVDEAYDVGLVKPLIYLGRILHKVVDEFVIDLLLVNGSAWLVRSMGRALRRLQTGDVQRYAAYVLLGLGVIAYLMLFR
jgi:NADH-quinone oxidoreductase subunit L